MTGKSTMALEGIKTITNKFLKDDDDTCHSKGSMFANNERSCRQPF